MFDKLDQYDVALTPQIAGNPYVFFSPIFNFADSSISVGVVLLLLFYRKEISEITLKKKNEA